MLSTLKKIYNLLSFAQRRKFHRLQILVIIMALFEVIGVFGVGVFIALLSNLSILDEPGMIQNFYINFQFSNSSEFIVAAGFIVLSFISLSSLLSMFTLWRLTIFGALVGADLSDRLYVYYINQNWLFHLDRNSSDLTNKIALETARITNSIIGQFMHLNGKLVLAIIMIITIFIYSPPIAIGSFVFFGGSYALIYKLARSRLDRNSIKVTQATQERFKLMNEGFGGIKDTLLLGRQHSFEEQFAVSNHSYYYHAANNTVIGVLPRYLMELFAFISIILFILIIFFQYNGDISPALPVIAVFALAGLKILPAFQQVYSGFATMRGNLYAFENLSEDLHDASDALQKRRDIQDDIATITFQDLITVKNISFQYPNSVISALQDVCIDIPYKGVIGLVGSSGSGKSTLADMIMGLLKPTHGSITIDKEILTNSNLRAWQDKIGFVSQRIFLSDTSVRQNVAFGIQEDEIDDDSVNKALELANLKSFVDTLPDGTETYVGERGIQLSGGQMQRIGIARALYHDAEVLVFDEATSSLDGLTEKLIMEAINKFFREKTIILIAHRLATVKKCDVLYLLDKGRLIDHGSYKDLRDSNIIFKNMTENS